MVDIAKKYEDELPIRRDEVESAYRYFKENNQRYEQGREFIFKTSISEELRNTLVNIEWPIYEVNTLESFISRLAGEFAKQMPSPSTRLTGEKSDSEKSVELIKLLDGKLRYIFESPQTDNIKKAMYIECISGGFSAAKLVVDYINPMAFEQDVTYEKCYDPTLCYFDPIARKNHKGDGRFCGELVPFTEEEFKIEWPDIDLSNVDYTRDALTAGNLHWYYMEGQDSALRKILYVADHYIKKEVKKKIVLVQIPNLKPLIEKITSLVKTAMVIKKHQEQRQQQEQSPDHQQPIPQTMQNMQSTGMQPSMQPTQGMQRAQQPQQSPENSNAHQNPEEKPKPFLKKSMTEEQYEVFAEMWSQHSMLPKPKIINQRTTVVTEIWHYRFMGNKLLERPKKTNFPILPIIFFDGNSHILANKQMTRPYHYQAMDAQKMKNIVAITMMNAIENMPQTRLMMAKETIPEEPAYQETLKNPQRPAAAIIYNSMGETNDNRPLPPPMPLNFQSFGGELVQLYNDIDRTIQIILGNFDQQIGIQNKELSGVAIQEGATQSNNAAMPYINNYMDGMNQIARGIVQMIPKLVRTARTMPIIDKNGLHQAILVNDPDNELTKLDYNSSDIDVVVKSSVNFEIQKDRTFNNLATLMQLPDPNPWKGFFGGPAATDLLDNMTVRNQDMLKEKFLKYQVVQEQKDAQNQQMAMAMNPAVIQMQELQVNSQLKQQEMQLKAMDQKMTQQIEGMKVFQTFIESVVHLRESADKMAIEKSRIQAENNRTATEGAQNALEAAMTIDRHLGDQMDRQMEHVYKQVELGDQLNETEIKRQALSQKNEESIRNEG